MNVPVNFSAIAPEIVLIVVACVLLAGGVFLPQRLAERLTPVLAAGGLLAALVVAAVQYQHAAHWSFDHTLRIDAFGQATRLIVFGSGLLAVCVSWGSSGGIKQRAVEFNALLLTACAGMSLLAVANSFVTLFVALELFSIALYVLVAIDIDSEPSLEGGLKYLIVGSVGAAFILYGAALVYGATGQLEFDRIAAAGGDRHGVLLLAGIAFVVVGLGFKANAAPFHMWTPDAYEGAPTPVTTFMSAATKAVALIVTMRVLSVAFPGQSDVWETGVAAVAIVSFVWGNLAALRQTNVKRMLGYSTVGHTGFLLTAVAANSNLGARALLYYLTVYATMNIGAFAVVAIRERELGRPVEIADFAGWGYRRPLLSIVDAPVHAQPGRLPAHRRVHRQALHLQRRRPERPDLPGSGGRRRHPGRPRLLPEDPLRTLRPRRRAARRGPLPGAATGLVRDGHLGGAGALPRHRADAADRPRPHRLRLPLRLTSHFRDGAWPRTRPRWRRTRRTIPPP